MAQLKILIVDDNAHVRKLARAIVGELAGAEICECGDGRAAIETCQVWRPDIALVDYEMTPMDGVRFTKLVRGGQTPLPSDLPIVMMTGHADKKSVELARAAGVNGFIVKPLSVGMVIKQIDRTLAAARPHVFHILAA